MRVDRVRRRDLQLVPPRPQKSRNVECETEPGGEPVEYVPRGEPGGSAAACSSASRTTTPPAASAAPRVVASPAALPVPAAVALHLGCRSSGRTSTRAAAGGRRRVAVSLTHEGRRRSPSADDDAIGATAGAFACTSASAARGTGRRWARTHARGCRIHERARAAVSLSNDGKNVVGAPVRGRGDAGLGSLVRGDERVWKKVGQDLTGGDVGADVIWFGRKLTMSAPTRSGSRRGTVWAPTPVRSNLPLRHGRLRVDGTRERRRPACCQVTSRMGSRPVGRRHQTRDRFGVSSSTKTAAANGGPRARVCCPVE